MTRIEQRRDSAVQSKENLQPQTNESLLKATLDFTATETSCRNEAEPAAPEKQGALLSLSLA